MAGSSFGTLFRVTTFGESHCKGVGAIVDGVPSRLQLTEKDIQPQLDRRRPGQSRLTTPRNETDKVTILSGTESGITLGTPIGLFVPNENVRPKDYEEMTVIPRPGHADYTYHVKYGVAAASGGGRSSARETIGRVAAGAIAEKWLQQEYGTRIVTFVSSIGTVELDPSLYQHPSGRPWTREEIDRYGTLTILRNPKNGWKLVNTDTDDGASVTVETKALLQKEQTQYDTIDDQEFVKNNNGTSTSSNSSSSTTVSSLPLPCYEDADGVVYDRDGNILSGIIADSSNRSNDIIVLRCPHAPTAARMATLIREVKAAQDSTGGVLTTVISNVPIGLGEPCFDKLEALLAHAMLSLPATKGFEIGSGFHGTKLRGSQHNDAFVSSNIKPIDNTTGSAKVLLRTETNNAGGTLGGISSGADLVFRVAIKPVSTISQAQTTVNFNGEPAVLEARGRHDPCVLPRAPPLVEGMAAIVLADTALIQRSRGPVYTLRNPTDDTDNNVF